MKELKTTTKELINMSDSEKQMIVVQVRIKKLCNTQCQTGQLIPISLNSSCRQISGVKTELQNQMEKR